MKRLKDIFKNIGAFILAILITEVIVTLLVLFLYYQEIMSRHNPDPKEYFTMWAGFTALAPIVVIVWLILHKGK